MTPEQENEHRLDCLARAIMKLPKSGKVAWAAKQKQSLKDDIRQRIERIRSDQRG